MGDEALEVAEGLRADQGGEVVRVAGDGDRRGRGAAHGLHGDDLVGAALVKLAGRVQEPGSIARGDGHAAEAVAQGPAQRLQARVVAVGQVGLDRHVVALLDRALQPVRHAGGVGRLRLRQRQRVEDLGGVLLRLGHVGLVKRVDGEHVACNRGCNLPAHELLAQVVDRLQFEGDGVAVVAGLHLGRGHGDAAHALLAGRLRHELLDPQAERGEVLRADDRDLVASLLRGAAHRHAELDRGLAVRVDGAGAQLGDVEPEQRRGHEAEVGQHRVAPADVGRVAEDPVEPGVGGELVEDRAGVGDGGEPAAVLHPLPEVGEQRLDLEGAAGLGGHEEEGVGGVDGADGLGVGGVEDEQALVAADRPQHLGPERRAAHAEQHDAGGVDRVGPRLELRGLAPHALGHVEPAEPVGGHVARRPQRRVPREQPLHDPAAAHPAVPLFSLHLRANAPATATRTIVRLLMRRR